MLLSNGSSGPQQEAANTRELRSKPETVVNVKPASCGRPFGNYELLEIAGRGGMGVVYRARQLNLNRIVAVKLLPLGEFSRPEAVQRFRVEATAAASLQHPNIVAIHDFGEQDGQHFFSMEYVEGRTLADVAKDQPLSPRTAAGYLRTIAEAVHYAHQRGILHRDIKPSNILLDSADQPRITDFGLAKRFGGEPELGPLSSDLTITGQVLGSPSFVAPEQLGGSRRLGPAADVYSLGAVLYQLLTRQPPFQADTIATLLKEVSEKDPVPPRLLNPQVPVDLETICLKCLEKEPSRRYLTAEALGQDLGRFLEGTPIEARPVGLAGRAGKWCRRHPALAGMTAALVTVVLLGVVGVLWQWRRASQSARDARASKYAADMHRAQLVLADNNRPFAIRLLNEHRPHAKGRPSRDTDLRGWEWRYLWQLCQGDESETLHRYPSEAGVLALSAQGDRLAVATFSEVALWSLSSRKFCTNLPIRPTSALAFSPQEGILAVGTWNTNGRPVVEVWNVSPAEPERKLTLAVGNHSLSFSGDGESLAVFDDQGKVTVTEVKSGRLTLNLPAQLLRSSSAGVAFAPDGCHLAIGEEYGGLRLVNVRTGADAAMDTQTYCTISALAFSADSRLLAAGFGYGEGTIQLWDAQTRKLLGQMRKHAGDVTALAFTPTGRQLVSASGDGTIRIWRVDDQAELCRLQSSGGEVRALALLNDGAKLVTGDSRGAVCFWNTSKPRTSPHTNLWVAANPVAMRDVTKTGFLPGTMDPRAVRRLGAAFTPDGLAFLTTDASGTLTQWELQTARLLRSFPELGSNYWGVALSADARWLAAGNGSGRIIVWDWKSLQPLTNFPAAFDWFGSLRFSSNGSYLIATLVRNDKSVNARIWRTSNWSEIPLTGSQFGGLWCLELAPDERSLAVGYKMGHVKLFHWPTLEHKVTLIESPGSAFAVAFSPDGKRLAAARFDGIVRVWDLAARREEAALPGHLNTVLGAAFSPDGRRLATGGTTARDAVKLWDLTAQSELLTLPAEGHYFMHVAWSPDGNTLTATALTGMAHFWHAPSREEIETAEQESRRSKQSSPQKD